MSRAFVLLLAVVSGAAVGNLYYAQPLLDLIAGDLHVGHEAAGLLVTGAQLGYTAGILFIVPLGDVRNRKHLVPLMMLLAALSLAACAAAPGFVVLVLALVAVGLTTVAAQLLIPLAGDMADDATRGRVVGTVVSGALVGILVARIVGGLVAGVLGWRSVFALAAALMLVLAAVLHRVLPSDPPRRGEGYGSLLGSVLRLVRRERALQVVMTYGAISFGTFSLFWTALTFLLSGPPYGYPTAVIGVFGLAGLVGALAAQGAGRLHDRGWSDRGTGLTWLLAVLAWGACALGGWWLAWLLLGILVFDVATQGQRILNQAQIFEIFTTARSRANTAYISGNFVGGALGSLLASLLWGHGGWLAVCAAGAALSAAAFVLWLAARRAAPTARPAAGARREAGTTP
jgi:predicted MFS family arabinose efflux permease